MEKQVRFIVLNRTKYQESDLIVHGLETTGQRLNMLARGALKSKKRFGGGLLEPTHFLEGTVKPARREEGLATLEEARLLEPFEGLRQDYDRLTLSLKLLDAIDRSNPGEHFPEIFNLLGNALKKLSAGGDLARLECQFGLKFLKLHGVLEFEPWMAAFLEKPIAADDEEGNFPPVNHGRLTLINQKIKAFIAGYNL